MGRRLALGLVTVAIACQGQPFKPEIPAPSEARIRELAQIAQPVAHEEAPFQITLTPALPIVPAGGAVWVHCFVPRSFPESTIVYGVSGHVQSGPVYVEQIEYKRLVEHLSCGTWRAFCVVKERISGRERRREIALKVLGVCNVDG